MGDEYYKKLKGEMVVGVELIFGGAIMPFTTLLNIIDFPSYLTNYPSLIH